MTTRGASDVFLNLIKGMCTRIDHGSARRVRSFLIPGRCGPWKLARRQVCSYFLSWHRTGRSPCSHSSLKTSLTTLDSSATDKNPLETGAVSLQCIWTRRCARADLPHTSSRRTRRIRIAPVARWPHSVAGPLLPSLFSTLLQCFWNICLGVKDWLPTKSIVRLKIDTSKTKYFYYQYRWEVVNKYGRKTLMGSIEQ